MTLKEGFLLFLVLMLNSAAMGSEGEHQEGSKTHGNIGPMNNRQGKFVCSGLGGQCTKKKDTCPIWLPLESPYRRPYCRNRKRCCYRDSCPNPIFEAFHVCATCSSSEEALDFVKELWGQPSTNPRNTTVFGGQNITYTLIYESKQPSCRSNFVDTWDCFQDSEGYWIDCQERSRWGCKSDHALGNGHLSRGINCLKDGLTTEDFATVAPTPEGPRPMCGQEGCENAYCFYKIPQVCPGGSARLECNCNPPHLPAICCPNQ